MSKKTTTTNPDTVIDVLQNVSTEFVHISFHNTRQPTEKEVTDSGLLASIKEQGQLTPGLGRPHPDKPGHIELAAGACRLVACAKLGIPYRVVVKEMTDAELKDAILTDNLQRTNPDPEAEAELIQHRLDEGMTPGEIAAKYGKSELWVKRRLKILNIDPSVRKKFAPNGDLAHYTTEMKERIGDLPVADQKAFVKDSWNAQRCTTLKGLCDCINRGSNSLEGQDWINDPATAIDGCGPGCATDTSKSLFRDPKAKCGICMNGTCFKKRRQLAIELAFTAALADSKLSDVVIYATDYFGREVTHQGKTVKVMDSWDFKDKYKVSKKKTDLIGIRRKSETEFTRVFLETIGKAKASGSGTATGNNAPKISREDALTGKRLAAMNTYLREALEIAPVPTTVPLMRLVALFGTMKNNSFCMSTQDSDTWNLVKADQLPPLSIHFKKEKDTEDNVIWDSVRKVILQRLQFGTNKDLLQKHKRNEMDKIAWLIGFDWEGEWQKTCTQDLPVPKSWGQGIDPITLKPIKIAAAGKSVIAKATEAMAKKKAKKAAKKKTKAA